MSLRYFSIIVPVYNRPEETKELLESLIHQTYKNFEVIIVEDGSTIPCKEIIDQYSEKLQLSYFFKPNTGQGFSRNYGYERAKGDYFIVFDSDCLIPPHYLTSVNDALNTKYVDCYGGPDREHPTFSAIQKAISFSMTSILTTGGIRGNKKHLGVFHPRSFNMGISRKVFEVTRGYKLPKKGEDIEFSIRIIRSGFTSALFTEAYVFHKRRTSLLQFFKQLHFFGTARINIFRFYPDELKLAHFFPLVFTLGLVLAVLLTLFIPIFAKFIVSFYGIYTISLLVDALIKTKSPKVSILGVVAAYIQLIAYGIGFGSEAIKYLKKPTKVEITQ